jgi:hypothetical protein
LKDIRVKKEKLIEILKTNRDSHVAINTDAKAGYVATVEAKLRDALARLKAGGKFDPHQFYDLAEPESFEKSYTRAIGMLELSEDDEIALSELDYQRFVQDEWEWKHSFDTSNNNYATLKRK